MAAWDDPEFASGARTLHGDTAISSRGLDTYGSRSLVVGGAAVVKAAEKVVQEARKIAAEVILPVPPTPAVKG